MHKLIKNERISRFMMNTMKDRNIMGDEQYRIRQRVWIMGLNIINYLHFGAEQPGVDCNHQRSNPQTDKNTCESFIRFALSTESS